MALEFFSTASFLRGTQCDKSLFLHVNYPELRDKDTEPKSSVKQRRVAAAKLTGHLFPEGVFAGVDITGSCEDSFELTKKHMKNSVKTIYNACFVYENLFCIVDVLNRENGYWKTYGVWNSDESDDTMILSGAHQYYVIARCGVRVDDFLTVTYKTKMDSGNKMHMDYNIQSIRERIVFLQERIEDKINHQFKVLKKSLIPDTLTGEHCRIPKKCDYFEYCRFSGSMNK